MMLPDAPILEFDPDKEAILEPSHEAEPVDGMPERAVACFFYDVLDELAAAGRLREIESIPTELGKRPVYLLETERGTVAVYHAGLGAPLAVGLMEMAITMGCRKFIVCGGCGVLHREVAAGRLLIPTAAVRDEGTSYHYLPAAREVCPSPEGVAALERVLKARGVEYLAVKTWTTDAYYRETRQKAARRAAEGCLAVEMEASALFALAQFRGVSCAQILYSGDLVIETGWDSRDWSGRSEIRRQLFWLAVDAVFEM